jgi:hypothetical protein
VLACLYLDSILSSGEMLPDNLHLDLHSVSISYTCLFSVSGKKVAAATTGSYPYNTLNGKSAKENLISV